MRKHQPASNGQEEVVKALKKELDEMRAGQQALMLLLAEIKSPIVAIQETQKALQPVTMDTNDYAHKVKHTVEAFPRNMQGLIDLSSNQYDKLKDTLLDFRQAIHDIQTRAEYSDEVMSDLATYIKELKDIVTIAQFREIIAEVKFLKQKDSNKNYLWWILGAIGATAAVIVGVITAARNIRSLLFIADSINSLF